MRPFSMYGHPIFATKDGAILQNAMIPFGVDGGTKSRAADKMMTYSTESIDSQFVVPIMAWRND